MALATITKSRIQSIGTAQGSYKKLARSEGRNTVLM